MQKDEKNPTDLVDSIESKPDKVDVVKNEIGANVKVRKRLRKEGRELIWFNFQMGRPLKNRLDVVKQTNRINLSEYFRRCAEILVELDEDPTLSVEEVTSMAKGLLFKHRRKKSKILKSAR